MFRGINFRCVLVYIELSLLLTLDNSQKIVNNCEMLTTVFVLINVSCIFLGKNSCYLRFGYLSLLFHDNIFNLINAAKVVAFKYSPL